jgi:nitrate reductase (cytochrome), electron transfer subunit
MKMSRFVTTLAALALLGLPGCADEAPVAPVAPVAGQPATQAAAPAAPEAAAPTAAPAEPVVDAHPRAELRATRGERRSYDGAPPVIPHELDEYKQDCIFCHRQSLSLGGVWSPKMSHPPYSQCEQCHVHVANTALGTIEGGPPLADSRFEPLRYGLGERSFEGAPPTIPHPVSIMRQTCTACHGLFDDESVRPEHYRRTQCVQCHVPNADFEMLASLGPPDFPVAELRP